jgi:hypothetical protein
MPPKTIIPRFKLLMRYDINQDMHEAYYQFVVGEFVPTLQSLGLYMLQVYHTAYGHYPVRQAEFVAEDLETIQAALNSDTWERLQTKLNSYTNNYSYKIVRFRDSFQF